ncbi:MAG TPA: matrixin family metalloprotease [Gemmatimonadales bacterium]|nr:matrixin family metalloprotease [Gemmatimonadales bacterium]
MDRKIAAIISSLVVLTVCAVLVNLFSTPRSARRGPRLDVPGGDPTAFVQRDPAVTASSQQTGVAAGTSAPATTEQLEPVTQPNRLSYVDQLARAESRRRIRLSAGYTYLDEVVAASGDSGLHRWDGRMQRPIRVHVESSTVANFRPAMVEAVRAAAARWEEAGIPVRFDLDADSARAEVSVRWKVQFEMDRTGQTDLTWDSEGRVVSGVITIATFDPKGSALSPDDVRVVALHEFGHLLGLDHSADSTDIMFARTRVRDLSARDIRTATLLYQLAPGPLSGATN